MRDGIGNGKTSDWVIGKRTKMIRKLKSILNEKREISFAKFLEAFILGYVVGFITCIIWGLG